MSGRDRDDEPPAPKYRGRARGRFPMTATGTTSPPGTGLTGPVSSENIQRATARLSIIDPTAARMINRYGSTGTLPGDTGGNGGGNGGNGGNGNGGNGGSPPGGGRGSPPGGNGDGNGQGIRQSFTNAQRYDFCMTRTSDSPAKPGVSGTNLNRLYSNYFMVKTTENWCVFHYSVAFTPLVDLTRDKRKLVEEFRSSVPGLNFAYDGHSIWTTSPIPNPSQSPEIEYVTRYLELDQKLGIKLVAQLAPLDPQYLQIYNNIVRMCLRKLKLCPMGRNYFDPNMKDVVRNRDLEIWPGFVTTMRNHDAGLLYCVELTNKVIRSETVMDIMNQIKEGGMRDRLSGDMIKEKVRAEVVGVTVLTRYNNRTYRVDDIAWNERVTDSFYNEREQANITFLEYYRKHFRGEMNIQDLRQPLLISNRKKRDIRRGLTEPIKLIPELCFMTGLTERMRSDFQFMRDLGQYLFRPPTEKFKLIREFVARLNANHDTLEELRGWGLEINNAPLMVSGRLLDREKVNFIDGRGNQVPFTADDKGDFTNGLKGGAQKMFTNTGLQNWAIVVPERNANGASNFISILDRVGRPIGFNVNQNPLMIKIQSPSPTQYATAIRDAVNQVGGKLQLVFVVLPSKTLPNYSTVKKLTFGQFGIASQCALIKNVDSPKQGQLMNVATKIVVQMNAKLGGEPWAITVPMRNIMIVGFDVHHGGADGKSIGAMVASTNGTLSQFFSTISFFSNMEELSTNMPNDISKCLRAYKNLNNGTLPDRIFFYRDGVGEGQLNHVYNTELKSITDKIKNIYERSNLPSAAKLTFFVVSKRINTRFFLRQGGQECINPPPGSVVDSDVTLPERWDFFMIAQSARQGAVSPTNYNIIYDTNKLDSDKYQRLTHKLCYMYFNWSGPVAVPSVVQYAHKMAFLCGSAMNSQVPHDNLLTKLHYL